jgi:hypothetical protein
MPINYHTYEAFLPNSKPSKNFHVNNSKNLIRSVTVDGNDNFFAIDIFWIIWKSLMVDIRSVEHPDYQNINSNLSLN